MQRFRLFGCRLSFKPYILLFFGSLCIVVATIVVIRLLDGKQVPQSSDLTLRVSFPADRPISSYDPASVSWDYEGGLFNELFSRLIEFDSEDRMIGGMASSFHWEEGSKAVLKIRDNIVTIDGIPITAEDVEFSLKRAIVLNSTNHADLVALLCDGNLLKSINDPCPRMEVKDNNTIVFHLREKYFFFFSTIGCIDLSIVPIRSIDPKTLKIIDFRNTSGPYFVESSDSQGNMTLAANQKHFSWHPMMPQKLVLVPRTTPESIVEGYRKGIVDHIPTWSHLPVRKYFDLFRTIENSAQLHTTMAIRVGFAYFTENGLKIPVERRLKIAKKMHQAIDAMYGGKDDIPEEPTLGFIPPANFGGLSSSQTKTLKEFFDSIPDDEVGRGLRLKSYPVSMSLSETFGQFLPEMSIKIGDLATAEENPDDEPDLLFIGMDTSPGEEMASVTLLVREGIIVPEGSSSEWLAKYSEEANIETRRSMLNSAHFRSLVEDPRTIPFFTTVYVAITRKPWATNFSRLTAGPVLHSIRWNP